MIESCIRCGRSRTDLIHDSPNAHGWTGCAEMHPFVDGAAKTLLQWTSRNVGLQGKAGQKGSHLTEDQAKWNQAIAAAEAAVDAMFVPLPADRLAMFDRYWADEYAKRAVAPPGGAGSRQT